VDATDFGSREQNTVRFFLVEEFLYVGLAAQVELRPPPRHDLRRVGLLSDSPNQRPANHAAMTSNENFLVRDHFASLFFSANI
jgi:hypothetical protein